MAPIIKKDPSVLVKVEDSYKVHYSGFSIFSLLVILLLVFSVFRIVFDGEKISLLMLFNFIQNVPQFPTDWITSFSSIQAAIVISDWGIFQFFGDFLNFITSLFFNLGSVALYVSVGAANLVIFATYVIGFLFS